MITINEILDKYHIWTTQDGDNSILKEDVKLAMIEYGEKLLEYAAKKANSKCINVEKDYVSTTECSECEYHIVNKDSILNIIKKLK